MNSVPNGCAASALMWTEEAAKSEAMNVSHTNRYAGEVGVFEMMLAAVPSAEHNKHMTQPSAKSSPENMTAAHVMLMTRMTELAARLPGKSRKRGPMSRRHRDFSEADGFCGCGSRASRLSSSSPNMARVFLSVVGVWSRLEGARQTRRERGARARPHAAGWCVAVGCAARLARAREYV